MKWAARARKEAVLVEPGRGVVQRGAAAIKPAAHRRGLRLRGHLVGRADGRVLRALGLLLRGLGAHHADDHEHGKGEQGDHQDVHGLEALERAAEEHGGEQAAGGETGERAHPLAHAAGRGGGGACGSRARGGSADRRRAGRGRITGEALLLLARAGAGAEALGLDRLHGQAQAQHEGSKEREYLLHRHE